MIKLIVADDHQLFRQGLIALLNEFDDVEVVAEARDGAELVELFLKLKPDLAIVDISMPGLTGYDALNEVRKFIPRAKFLYLSMYSTPEYVQFTRKIGGKGLIGKNIERTELSFAIYSVVNGKEYYGKEWTPEKLQELEDSYRRSSDLVIDPDLCLTVKEKEVLYYLSEGYSTKEIADRLNCGTRTVESHRYKISKKVGANSSAQLIAFAIKFVSVHERKKSTGT